MSNPDSLADRVADLERRLAALEGYIANSVLAPGAGLDERLVAIETAVTRVQRAFNAARGVVE